VADDDETHHRGPDVERGDDLRSLLQRTPPPARCRAPARTGRRRSARPPRREPYHAEANRLSLARRSGGDARASNGARGGSPHRVRTDRRAETAVQGWTLSRLRHYRAATAGF
jgi:hypothetical protein